jgi:hypothetical protein
MKTCALPLITISALALLAPADSRANLIASTYLGGSGYEGWQYSGAIDVAVAADGTVYVVGVTASADFPVTAGARQGALAGQGDIFLARFASDFSVLLAATYLGGSGMEGCPTVGFDGEGNVYVAGFTKSVNFPTTAGAYDVSFNGSSAYEDFFVAKLDAGLTTLLAATFVGGSYSEMLPELSVDAAGNVFLSGFTNSTNFPVTAVAYDRSFNGAGDAVVAKLNGSLTSLLASTFLGGSREEFWVTHELDAEGNVYLTGGTESVNFPTTAGAYDRTFNGPAVGDYVHDVFVSKLDNSLATLLASTFVGTDGFEAAGCLAVDGNNNVYVGGHTDSVHYPVTPGALDEDHNGINEYFLTRLNGELTTILASTFLTPADAGFGFCDDIIVAGNGDVFVGGDSGAANFPVTADAYDISYNGGDVDGFVARLDADLTTFQVATFLGGSAAEGVYALALANNGDLVLAGYTISINFPVTAGSYDQDYNGGNNDSFLARFSSLLANDATAVGDEAAPGAIPQRLALAQNFPNPFNPSTIIRFSLPAGSPVRLGIYDTAGRLIRILVNENREAGHHTIIWDGLSDDGRALASGVYFCRLETDGGQQTRPMSLVK